MLHTIDISINNNINNINKKPHLLEYWITGKLSPCIKDKNIKTTTNDNRKKNPKK
jgi:hypothetical protein